MPRPRPIPEADLVAAILSLDSPGTLDRVAEVLFAQRMSRDEGLATSWENWPDDLKEPIRRDAREIIDSIIDN